MATKLPKTLGATADLLYRMRQERLELQAAVDAAKEKEQVVKHHALALLQKERADSARGALAQITKVVRDVPQVKDWEAVYAYAKKHDALDLFERRIHRQAWRDRVEVDGEIPGIGHETILDLHVTTKRGV